MKLTAAEARIVEWMRDGDRALNKCYFDESKYGWHEAKKNCPGDHLTFHKVATRKQVEALISKGIVEWYKCSPYDLRAMLVENRLPTDKPETI